MLLRMTKQAGMYRGGFRYTQHWTPAVRCLAVSILSESYNCLRTWATNYIFKAHINFRLMAFMDGTVYRDILLPPLFQKQYNSKTIYFSCYLDNGHCNPQLTFIFQSSMDRHWWLFLEACKFRKLTGESLFKSDIYLQRTTHEIKKSVKVLFLAVVLFQFPHPISKLLVLTSSNQTITKRVKGPCSSAYAQAIKASSRQHTHSQPSRLPILTTWKMAWSRVHCFCHLWNMSQSMTGTYVPPHRQWPAMDQLQSIPLAVKYADFLQIYGEKKKKILASWHNIIFTSP